MLYVPAALMKMNYATIVFEIRFKTRVYLSEREYSPSFHVYLNTNIDFLGAYWIEASLLVLQSPDLLSNGVYAQQPSEGTLHQFCKIQSTLGVDFSIVLLWSPCSQTTDNNEFLATWIL